MSRDGTSLCFCTMFGTVIWAKIDEHTVVLCVHTFCLCLCWMACAFYIVLSANKGVLKWFSLLSKWPLIFVLVNCCFRQV